jgi:hypothetical protein
MTMSKPSSHRGRLQVQGDDMEKEHSAPWSLREPHKADQALIDLTALEKECRPNELKVRQLAFAQARRFIKNARDGGGVCAPVSESYQKPDCARPKGYESSRVDIEVKVGRAFV